MIKKRLQAIALLVIFFVLYYGFLLDFMLSVKTSIVNTLQSWNMTTVDVPMKEYNGTTWVSRPIQFDLAGFIDVILTMVVVIAPLLFAIYYLWP